MTIVDCQAAVDWLLETQFKPKGDRAVVRVERTTTGGGVTDADRRILEKMTRGQRGDQIRRLLDGDAGAYRKADGSPDWSAADLALCNALAFYADRDAARMDSLFRNSGLYSAPGRAEKWDGRHYADGRTYGEGTIGAAIAGCSRTYSDLVGYPSDKEWPRIHFTGRGASDDNHDGGGKENCSGAETIPTDRGADGAETFPAAHQGADRVAELEAEVARLRRALLESDDTVERLASIVEAQQTITAAYKAENDEHRARFQQFKKVLSNPEISGNEKVVALVVAAEAHAPSQPLEGARVEWAKVSLQGKPEEGWIGLKEKTGLTANTISKTLERLSQGDAAPFEKQVTRDWRTRKDGTEGFVTAIQVRPLRERLSDTLRIIATFKPDKPQHGGSEAAANAREHVRRCRKHPGAEPVASTLWRCPVPSCRAILDEEPILDHKLGDPEPIPPPVVVSRTLGHNFCDPDLVNGHAVTLDHQVGDPTFPDELAARRARETVAVPIRAPDPWKQPGILHPADNDRAILEPIPREGPAPAVPEPPPLPAYLLEADWATRAAYLQEQAAAAGSEVSP